MDSVLTIPHNTGHVRLATHTDLYTVMISAGEASGDTHAAHALQALQSLEADVASFGMGAGELQAAGTELIVDCRDLSVIGFVDALRNYHRFLRRLKRLRIEMRKRRPDLLLLVDFPDFNLKLAETAQELGVPVLFYVSPQIWAWRPKRIHRIGRLVTHMAVLFPFEVSYYEEAGIPVTYTGNPLVDEIECPLSPTAAAQSLGLATERPVVALLPGSRRGELQRHLPVMLDAAVHLLDLHPDLQFVLPLAASLPKESVSALVGQHRCQPTIIDGNAHTVMRAANVVVCASGTATLETALIGTPMVLIYRLNRLNYELMRRLIRIPDIGLVNIVAGERIVPELLQSEANAQRICREVTKLLTDSEATMRQQAGFERVRQQLGPGGASQRVAKVMLQLLQRVKPSA